MMLSEAKDPPGSEKPSTIAQNSLSLILAASDCVRTGCATNSNPAATISRRKILKFM